MLDTILQWLYLNPEWLAVFIFLVALTESLALVGFAVPGVIILGGLTLFIGQHNMSILPGLVAAAIGAFLGDSLSFWLGEHSARRWLLQHDDKAWVRRGKAFLAKYGTASIVIGRFIGAFRPILPLIAGSLGMRPLVFYSVDFISAMAWSPAYLLPGYVLGRGLDQQAWLGNHYHLLAMVAIIIVGLFLFLRLRFRSRDRNDAS